jgi:hypothetical protein
MPLFLCLENQELVRIGLWEKKSYHNKTEDKGTRTRSIASPHKDKKQQMEII